MTLNAPKLGLLSLATASNRANEVGLFVRCAAGGNALVVYSGNQNEPGTWMEIGRTRLTLAGVDEYAFGELIR